MGIISKGELVFQDSLSILHERSQHNIAIRTLNNAAAGQILKAQGVFCEVQKEYLLLPALEDNLLAQCVAHMSENRVGVVRIEQRQKSLEDIFLELTGTAVSL
ncbi:hypothetical protein E4K67_23820 [Desulfosporosinus fructosivorans]|uniref:DUF4162 domain-containing protein n=1 Tax=Desulfosporosinus fructosivorans TaxID=2018669 RepID=A0A4Z0QZB2_9FIRM|nr:hypothetical protein [Desulfosporosinus fructosivorans]TGE35790.1 hypothetical protein E4K67_23820 [Desulfosporosinus fructosivorans]